jgi:hypothetical protein
MVPPKATKTKALRQRMGHPNNVAIVAQILELPFSGAFSTNYNQRRQ